MLVCTEFRDRARPENIKPLPTSAQIKHYGETIRVKVMEFEFYKLREDYLWTQRGLAIAVPVSP